MNPRKVVWAAGVAAVSAGVHLVDVPGAFPYRVQVQLHELATAAPSVEFVFRAGLVVELGIELIVATVLMRAVHTAGLEGAARLSDRALAVRLGGAAADLLCAVLAGVALALGGLTGLVGHLVSVFPDPLFAILVAALWVAADDLVRLVRDPPPPTSLVAPVAVHPARVRAELAQALDDGDRARIDASAGQLLGLIGRFAGPAESAAQQLALSVPLLLRCSVRDDCPPGLAARIAVRLGQIELRSVLSEGPEPVPGLPRAEGDVLSTQERLDVVARLMQFADRRVPGDVDAQLGLAWTRSAQQRDDEAQKLARAVRLTLDAGPRVPGDHRADLADVLRAVSAGRLGAGEQAERLLARVARNHRGGRLPQELAAAMDYARRVPATL